MSLPNYEGKTGKWPAMKKPILAGLAVAMLVTAVPATASAAPYLGNDEAKSALERKLHRSFKPGVQTSSLLAFCGHHGRRDVVTCDVLVSDWSGYAWCGGARIRETRLHYYVRWNLSQRHCELF